MRAYELKIGDSGEFGHFIGGIKNVTALNIKFNVNAYSDALSTSIPNTVEVFNLPLKYFINANDYKGKPIYLSAGFDKSVLALKARYKSIKTGLILQGTIRNVVPNFSSLTTPSVMFAIMMGSAQQIAGAPSNPIKGKALVIKSSRINKEELTLWMMNFLPPNIRIAFDNSVRNLVLSGNQSKVLTANNLSEALNKLMGINLYTYTTGNTINVQYLKDKQSWNKAGVGLNMSTPIKSLSNIKEGSNFITTTIKQKTEIVVDIDEWDIVSMPQVINSVTLQLTIRLRPDFKIGTKVRLPNKLLKTTLSDSSFGAVMALQGEMKVFLGGIYTVTGVNHTGEYYSTNVNSWITSLMLSKLED